MGVRLDVISSLEIAIATITSQTRIPPFFISPPGNSHNSSTVTQTHLKQGKPVSSHSNEATTMNDKMQLTLNVSLFNGPRLLAVSLYLLSGPLQSPCKHCIILGAVPSTIHYYSSFIDLVTYPSMDTNIPP